jgi:hypothetical protein
MYLCAFVGSITVYVVKYVCFLFSDNFNSWYYAALNDMMVSQYCSGSDMKGAVIPILRRG